MKQRSSTRILSRMKELIEYIKYHLTPNPFSCDKQIIEMASIAQPVLNRTKYNIVLHGRILVIEKLLTFIYISYKTTIS